MGAGNQMTRDEVIRFTREAGGFDITPEFLDRFAALVAAAEREACAKVCERHADSSADIFAAAIRARGEK
jgi:hypothetical protein